MTIHPFFHLPQPRTFSNFSDVNSYTRRLWDALHSMRLGKIECTGEITLRAGEATTVLNRKGLSNQSVVIFDPRTANAAADLYGGGMYVLTANRGTDSWTITHPNNANADKTFQFAALG